MSPFNKISKNIHFLKSIKTTMVLLILVSACKKEDDILDEEFPVFGTCEAVNPKGNLSFIDLSKGIFTYETSGGGKIVMDQYLLTITHKDYPGFSIQFWGITHENLNAKQIKDFSTNRRSLIFPDGTKITIVNGNLDDSRISIDIRENNDYHHINSVCKTLEYSAVNSPYAQKLDDMLADGETCTFEFTETGLLFLNIYTEDTVGIKVEKRVPLGELFKNEPNMVADYWP
ncbi:hypothetical protein [Mariniflexile sp.]|uniref:hypothetical protein n=1 Tax=Mariniflexile sp. TaxID=1979402 RepID=UPI004047735B